MTRGSTGTAAAAAIILLGSLLLLGRPALAQQSLTLNAGRFAVRGYDTRVAQDVVLENLNVFAFRLDDFNGGTGGLSWNVGLGEHLEAGLGLGFYQRTVPSVYLDYESEDGYEIVQEFRLRIVPATATMRVLPFGAAPVQPYFGAGVGLYAWRYAEFGEFIDFTTADLFQGRYVATGTSPGGILLGGVRLPIGDRYTVGLEMQYHQATGVVGVENGFLEDEIDLGGITSSFTFQVRF